MTCKNVCSNSEDMVATVNQRPGYTRMHVRGTLLASPRTRRSGACPFSNTTAYASSAITWPISSSRIIIETSQTTLHSLYISREKNSVSLQYAYMQRASNKIRGEHSSGKANSGATHSKLSPQQRTVGVFFYAFRQQHLENLT